MNRVFSRVAITLGALLMALTTAGIGFTPTLAASPATSATDPLVVIAQDATASTSCTMGIASSSGQACPAGTIIETAHVLLSQAQAQHEDYVMLPQGAVTADTAAQIEQQIDALVVAKGNAIRNQATPSIHFYSTNTPFVSPLSSMTPLTCSGSYYTWVLWYPFNADTSVNSQVNWTRNSNCSIHITSSSIQAIHLGKYVWYWQDAYAASTWSRNCDFVGNTFRSYNVNANEAAGYYYEPTVKDHDGCTFLDQGSYVNLGPLT